MWDFTLVLLLTKNLGGLCSNLDAGFVWLELVLIVVALHLRADWSGQPGRASGKGPIS